MSINEAVADALTDYAVAWRDSEGVACIKIATELRAAIEQHVAEAVKAEREAILDLVDDYAKDNVDLKAAIRARADNEVTP